MQENSPCEVLWFWKTDFSLTWPIKKIQQHWNNATSTQVSWLGKESSESGEFEKHACTFNGFFGHHPSSTSGPRHSPMTCSILEVVTQQGWLNMTQRAEFCWRTSTFKYRLKLPIREENSCCLLFTVRTIWTPALTMEITNPIWGSAADTHSSFEANAPLRRLPDTWMRNKGGFGWQRSR